MSGVFDAWNPGLTSEIPARLLPVVTLYRPENSTVGHGAATEAAEFCGLKPQDMVAVTVSRLVAHEVLIRVTADFYVPDGPAYEELGLNLRSMAARIIDGHIAPHMAEVEQHFEAVRADVLRSLDAIMMRDIYARPDARAKAPARGLFSRFLRRPPAKADRRQLPELAALEEWQSTTAPADTDLEQSCLTGLKTIVGGIVGRRGKLLADKALVLNLAANWVCNSYGSRQIGLYINPMIVRAAKAEGFRLLPYQSEPFIMNVKGASGAGKSTIRPLQRELAERLGVPWQDFALISPDYWRKYLLDYNSLGDDFKYAAMLTGQELEVIDKKLDGYIEEKALRQEIPHLLIDRFRFDSFSTAGATQTDGRLLSRFGATVFLFFVITPPPETVKRAWKRGIETGRYKAVDDLLYHNIEAYTGMPQLFFSWVNKDRQKVHFEFLDNDVPYGQRPRTAAFGWNRQITILDPEGMRRLGRYKHVDINARRPDDVYLPISGAEQDIVAECIRNIPEVIIADQKTLAVRARFRNGECIFADTSIAEDMPELATRPVANLPYGADNLAPTLLPDHVDAETEARFTVGAFGGDALRGSAP